MSPKGHQWLKDQSHQSMAKQPCLSMLDEFHSQTITIEHDQNRNKQIKNPMLKNGRKKTSNQNKSTMRYGIPVWFSLYRTCRHKNDPLHFQQLQLSDLSKNRADRRCLRSRDIVIGCITTNLLVNYKLRDKEKNIFV